MKTPPGLLILKGEELFDSGERSIKNLLRHPLF
jgi:hypothetical protein